MPAFFSAVGGVVVVGDQWLDIKNRPIYNTFLLFKLSIQYKHQTVSGLLEWVFVWSNHKMVTSHYNYFFFFYFILIIDQISDKFLASVNLTYADISTLTWVLYKYFNKMEAI